tara:strand:- start:2229 stop:2726 length:498 start_codon:yes stop_codon:yes gene_type:complete
MLFKMMTASIFKKDLYKHIELREGCKKEVYLDTLGKPTGGIGHLLTKKELKLYPVGSELSDKVINKWYQEDIEEALDACNSQCILLGLYEKEFKIALTSVNFQLGTKWYRKFPKAWHNLCHEKYQEAIDEIMYYDKEKQEYSLWYKQTPVRVLDFVNAIKDIIGE